VSRQGVPKSLIHAFIDEDAHLGACEQQFFGFFKGVNGSGFEFTFSSHFLFSNF
jgi:hypothetical protein